MKQLDRRKLSANIDAIAEADLAEKKVFGSAYCVHQSGSTVFEKYYGTTGLDGAPVTGKTIFRTASMTKPITAAAALILWDRGLLSLDEPAAKYLPALRGVHVIDADGTDHGEAKTLPTVRHMLTHTSGIGSDLVKCERMTPADKETMDASLSYHVINGLDFEPGTRQQYSGLAAFDTVGQIIEILTGMDFERYLQKELFAPCGMTDTVFTPSADQWARLTAIHNRIDGENTEVPMAPGQVIDTYPCTHFVGGGGLVSTLPDYLNFAKMLLNRGRVGKAQILSEEAVRQMSTPQVSAAIMPGNEVWGLGGRVITGKAYPSLPVGSFGWSGAYGCHFWVDPENELCAVFMKNSLVDGGAGNQSAQAFEQAVYTAFAL